MKRALIIIAVVMTAFGTYMSFGLLKDIFIFIFSHPQWILIIGAAVAIQLVGHLLRAKRTKLVIDQATSSSLRFQFAALSTGYLFNALLPLRIGELVRALLVARRLRISLLYTFVAVIIERVTDIIFLSIIIIIGALVIGGGLAADIIAIAILSGSFALAILVVVLLLKQENKYLLSAVNIISRMFNSRIRNSIRFKVWSLIFGLQNFFNDRKLVSRYISYAILSWICYFISAIIIVIALLGLTNILQIIVTGVSPYVISLPSFSPLDASTSSQLASSLPIHINSNNLDLYAKIIWAVLVLPMALIGFIALFSYRVTIRNQERQVDSYANKLLRHNDISQDFPSFLDSYFSGNSLARILHKLEITGNLRLVKYFKGGSDAITVLVMSAGGKLFVKKIIPIEYEDRLRAQFLWLKDNASLKYLVIATGEQKTQDYYAIDLEYNPENIPFFELIHHASLSDAEDIIEKVWKSVYSQLYKKSKVPDYDPKARDAFIDKHIFGCVDKAAESSEDILEALKHSTVTINGKKYDNLYQIMDKIKNNKQAWRDIATFSHSNAVHGDLTVDNILVSPITKQPVIIDPAPDGNIINGPVFDLGKLSQSFYCGYEFLFRDDEPVRLKSDNTVNYRESISARYMKLWKYIHTELAPNYVSEGERRAMLFHAAALHLRVLKHRVYINPENVMKFYATGIKTLNEFLEQYK
jgi:hypothetical protein